MFWTIHYSQKVTMVYYSSSIIQLFFFFLKDYYTTWAYTTILEKYKITSRNFTKPNSTTMESSNQLGERNPKHLLDNCFNDLSKKSSHSKPYLSPLSFLLACVWIELILLKLKTENWKHCSKIIFKCVNSTVGPIFNEKVDKKWNLWVREQCTNALFT